MRGRNSKGRQGHHSVKKSIRRVWALTRKEMRVLMHDKLAMVLLIIFPISMIVLATYGGSMGEAESDRTAMSAERYSTPKIGIADFDDSEGYGGADVSASFYALFEEYEEMGECVLFPGHSRNEMEVMLGKAEINAYIIIENGFEYNLSTHYVGFFTVVLDGYDLFIMADMVSLVDEILVIFQERFNFTGAIEINTTKVNVPQKAQTLFAMAGYFYPILSFAMPILIESQTIIGDIPKDRMILTPANKKEVIWSKMLGGTLINSILGVIMSVLSVILGLEIKSSFLVFFLVIESSVLAATMIGLLISAISKTSLAGFQYSLLVFLIQEILMLFIQNNAFLSVFPLFATQEMILQVGLRGVPLFECVNSMGVPYMAIILVESVLSFIGAMIVYEKSKSVI